MGYRQHRPLILLPVAMLGACAESPLVRLEQDLDAATIDVVVDPGSPVASDTATSLDGATADTGDAASNEVTEGEATSDAASPGGRPGDAGALDLDASLAEDAAMSVEAAAPMEAATPSCEAPQRACDSRCVDIGSDSQHCGACGNRCDSEESCVESRCLAEAPRGCTTELFDERVYLFCSEGRTWSDARRSCLEAGMDLTIVGSSAENEFVRMADAPLWLGANDQRNEGDWRFVPASDADDVSGAPLGSAPWDQGEPNNRPQCDGLSLGDRCLGEVSDEDCAIMQDNGRWNDTVCDQRFRYVCEAY